MGKEVKAEFPIGKSQWRKWGNEAREAYNKMRRQGFSHETGVAEANAVEAKMRSKPKKDIFDILEDVVETVADVAEVVETVAPAVAVAKTVARATRKKKAK